MEMFTGFLNPPLQTTQVEKNLNGEAKIQTL